MQKIVQNWKTYATLALGIFIGSYWSINAVLLMNHHQSYWHLGILLLPGMAVIFFVLMGRRYPVPYGAGLMILGVMSFFYAVMGRIPWKLATAFGGPVIAIGILFVVWRKQLPVEQCPPA